MQNSKVISYIGFENDYYQINFAGRRMYYLIKRIIDIVFSGCVLLVLLPVFVVLAIVIKLDSPGPVIFKQKRVGARIRHSDHVDKWEKTEFNCYKFRSMQHKASEDIHKKYIKALISNDQITMTEMEGGPGKLHKLTSDPRITRIGKVLRKYSLDELPQFWNVFIGDMSLVGPRPNIPYEVEMYNQTHLGRLQAKPGITGLQQITARCTASFEDQVKLDLQYIEQQSIWLDLFILIKTPVTVFTQKGV